MHVGQELRDDDYVPIAVSEGCEPPEFKLHFHCWRTAFSRFVDPFATRLSDADRTDMFGRVVDVIPLGDAQVAV